MNFLKTILGMLLLGLLVACQKNQETLTTDKSFLPGLLVDNIALNGEAHDAFWNYTTKRNLVARYLHDNEILDETTGNANGSFSFDQQLLPHNQTVLVTEVDGYYPYMVKFFTDIGYDVLHNYMIPMDYKDFAGHKILGSEKKIRLKVKLETKNPKYLIYLTNSENELVGYGTEYPHGQDTIQLTTIADEELLLHIDYFDCSEFAPIAIGSFSDDAVVGDIQVSNDFVTEKFTLSGNVEFCTPDLKTKSIYITSEHKTQLASITSNPNTSYAYSRDFIACEFPSGPIKLTSLHHSPYDQTLVISEEVIDHIEGQDINYNFSSANCYEITTHFDYELGSQPAVQIPFFNVVDIDDDGKVSGDSQYGSFRFSINGSSLGQHAGEFFIWDSPNAYHTQNANGAVFTITLNDGLFLEGEFESIVVDRDFQEVGIITGNFRAKIQ